MTYSASWTDLKDIVQWLSGGDESEWEDRTKALSDTIAILRELSRPLPSLKRMPSRGWEPQLVLPEAPAIRDAMPYLRGMLAAMRGHSRQHALAHGKAALELLPEG